MGKHVTNYAYYIFSTVVNLNNRLTHEIKCNEQKLWKSQITSHAPME